MSAPEEELPPLNLHPEAVIEIRGAPHKLLPGPVPGRLVLLNGRTGMPYMTEDEDGERGLLTPAGFDEMLRTGDIVIVDPPSAIAARRLAASAEWTVEEIEEEIDPAARKRLVECEVLDDAGVPNGAKAIAEALARLWTPELAGKYGEADNPHTIKRWRSERGKPGLRRLKDMVNMSGHGSKLPFWNDVVHESLWKAALRAHVNGGINYRDVHSEHDAEIQAINAGDSPDYPKPEKPHVELSYDTARRACIALESAAATEAREGKAMKDANWRGSGRPLRASRALELSIIDHTPLDVFVVDPDREMVLGRPWLTLHIDVHSRAVLGWVITFRDPSMWTMGEVIKRSNLPKRPPPCLGRRHPILRRIMGKSAEAALDNELFHTGHGMEDAAKGAGFAVRFAPIKKPRYRAIVERPLGTIPRKICELLPGAVRPIAWARKAGYDAEKFAVCTLNELEAVGNYAVAEYHAEPHEGLQDRQPALVFQKSVAKHGIYLVHDVVGFQRELLEVVPRVQLTNAGIRLWGLRFTDVREVPKLLDDLRPLEPRRQQRERATCIVKVKFDPENIGVIHVWNRNKRARRWVTLRCDDPDYAEGMPLWFHQDIRNVAKLEASGRPATDDEEAIVGFNTPAERRATRARRIQAIRNISPQAKARERDLVAQLYEIPRLRQITGNLVHLHTEEASPVTVDQFIAHDLAATTALDDEILAPRDPSNGDTPRRHRKDPAAEPRDRRQAGEPQPDRDEAAAVPRRRPRVTGAFS